MILSKKNNKKNQSHNNLNLENSQKGREREKFTSGFRVDIWMVHAELYKRFLE